MIAFSLLCFGLGGQVQGCDSSDAAFLPEPSYPMFEEKVYPILLRDCAFAACHGNKERMFQVYGPGRVRLADEEGEFPNSSAGPNKREIEVSYQRSRSMLLHRGDPRMAPLLRKPLQGSAHLGTDRWRRNVYKDQSAPGYAQLVQWATKSQASTRVPKDTKKIEPSSLRPDGTSQRGSRAKVLKERQ